MIFPKPIRKEKERRPMNKLGPVSKRRLAANKLRKPLAEEINHCEIARILRWRGITFTRCSGPLTWAHSVKCSKRGKDPVLEQEVVRACTTHHYYFADLLKPELTAEIVRQAIELREQKENHGKA
jgi:hypothetical protein